MCFAPQRRALFRHHNFQKWSEHGVFCTFWLGNVLRATTACNFSSLIWPAGSAPAALASLLFDHWKKHSVSRLCHLFAHLHLLSSDLTLSLLWSSFFSSLTLPISAFHLSILSEVWLLNFLRQLQLQLRYFTLYYTTLHYTTLHYTTLHYTTLHYTTLHYTTLHYTTPQLQPHHSTTTTTAALHHTTSSSCGWGDRPGSHCKHCSHCKKHSSSHLSVHLWIRSAIRDSQQPSSPIGFLFWNFRHRLVRYYW